MNTELKLVGEWNDVEFYSIPGMNGYAVSKCGKARSLDRADSIGRPRKGRELKQCLDRLGYPTVNICNGGRGRTTKIHRMMGFTFLGLQVNQQIDHINRIKSDNRLENLRIATSSENNHNRATKGYYVRGDRWVSMISVMGKSRYLGAFDTEPEARAAYVAAKRELGVVFPD